MNTLKTFTDNQIREEFVKRFSVIAGDKLGMAKDVYSYLSTVYADIDATIENFVVVFLNAQNELIKSECLSSGSINTAAVYPREIIKKVIEYGASAIILSHNHPSGSLSASGSDRALTKKLQAACNSIDVDVLDHLIMGNHEYISFADMRLL